MKTKKGCGTKKVLKHLGTDIAESEKSIDEDVALQHMLKKNKRIAKRFPSLMSRKDKKR
jgi:hypothetical protein